MSPDEGARIQPDPDLYLEEIALNNHQGVEPVSKQTFTACMEQLQEGYVFGVASTAGCLVERVSRDFYGIDIRIIKPRGTQLQELVIEAQLKASTTIRPDFEKEHFSYQFKKAEYLQHLAKKRETSKAILIVLATNKVQKEWTSVDHDSMSLRHCCYWMNLEGHAMTAGVQSPSVKIPVENRFDADELLAMFDRLERGEDL